MGSSAYSSVILCVLVIYFHWPSHSQIKRLKKLIVSHDSVGCLAQLLVLRWTSHMWLQSSAGWGWSHLKACVSWRTKMACLRDWQSLAVSWTLGALLCDLLCGLFFSQHGGWVQEGGSREVSIPRNSGRSYKASYDPAWKSQNMASATFCWPRQGIKVSSSVRKVN